MFVVFVQIRSLIGPDEQAVVDRVASADDDSVSFVETGAQVGKVRSFCEICILVMQMKQRGQPHLCAGLNTNYHITCIEVSGKGRQRRSWTRVGAAAQVRPLAAAECPLRWRRVTRRPWLTDSHRISACCVCFLLATGP